MNASYPDSTRDTGQTTGLTIPSALSSITVASKVRASCITLEDVTHIMRLGLKGPNAATWLEEQGVRVPSRANSWCPVAEDDGDIVARLGSSEFLIETPSRDVRVATIANELGNPIHGVYPVLREDRAFVLEGEAVHDVLAEVCNVNFAALRLEEREAIMTMMIGVAVTVVPQGNAAQRRYRIWCDPSYGDYLWSSLLDVARSYPSDSTQSFGGIR